MTVSWCYNLHGKNSVHKLQTQYMLGIGKTCMSLFGSGSSVEDTFEKILIFSFQYHFALYQGRQFDVATAFLMPHSSRQLVYEYLVRFKIHYATSCQKHSPQCKLWEGTEEVFEAC